MFCFLLASVLLAVAYGQKLGEECPDFVCNAGLSCTMDTKCAKECKEDKDCDEGMRCEGGTVCTEKDPVPPKIATTTTVSTETSNAATTTPEAGTTTSKATTATVKGSRTVTDPEEENNGTPCDPTKTNECAGFFGLCDPANKVCVSMFDHTCQANTDCPVGFVCSVGDKKCFPAAPPVTQPPIINTPFPRITGRPPTQQKPTCVDLHAPGRPSDCPQRKHLCNSALYFDDMTVQCPFTCGRCPGQNRGGNGANGGFRTCMDLHAPGRSSDCPQRKYLCSNRLYVNVMKHQCPKTCGFC